MAKQVKPATAGLRAEWVAIHRNYNRTEIATDRISSMFDPSVHACCPTCAFPQFQQLLTRNQNREIRIRQIAPRISQKEIDNVKV